MIYAAAVFYPFYSLIIYYRVYYSLQITIYMQLLP